MWISRRLFLRLVSACCADRILAGGKSLPARGSQATPDNRLRSGLRGSWKLESYSYTSNNRTYKVPDEMEATANFAETKYDVAFAAYISAVGMKRTRKASEAGTYTVNGSRIILMAAEASEEAEKGEELLLDVQIENDRMTLTSNNGANHEVWKKAS